MILKEVMGFDISPAIVAESMKYNKPLLVSGVIQRADAKNQNGRIYPKEVLRTEVSKYNQLVKENRAYGELDHRDENQVNLQNVSHVIRELKWNGNDLIGTVEILDTPNGKILKELYKAGCRVGISSRAAGSVQEDKSGSHIVQDDLQLICWDFVSNPSTHGAFVGPLQEAKRFENKVVERNKKIAQLSQEVANIIYYNLK